MKIPMQLSAYANFVLEEMNPADPLKQAPQASRLSSGSGVDNISSMILIR